MPPNALDGLGDHRLDLGSLGDVDLRLRSPSALAVELRRERLRLGAVQVGDDDARAFVRQAPDDALAEALRPAGHDDALPLMPFMMLLQHRAWLSARCVNPLRTTRLRVDRDGAQRDAADEPVLPGTATGRGTSSSS